jgi:hypothetical protein
MTEQNMIGDDWHGGDVYEQAETALCIWEHVIENNGRDDRDELEKSLYNWFTQGQGIFAGRAAAINLAWLVERAYQVGNGLGRAIRQSRRHHGRACRPTGRDTARCIRGESQWRS